MAVERMLPELRAREDRGPVPIVQELTTSGVPESLLGELLEDLLRRDRCPVLGSYPRVADVVVSIEASKASEAEARALVLADVAEVRRRLGPGVISDGRRFIHELVAELLLATRTKVAVAESVTGGMIADRLVSVAGISGVFQAGFTTYSDGSKVDVLGVRPETLRAHGAVSAECAREMAEGARRVARADVAVSTTGIAGPTGGTPAKPVGTLWIGLSTAEGSTATLHRLAGDRMQIRERAAHRALDALRVALLARAAQ
jgi:PncC family amidohydrolase